MRSDDTRAWFERRLREPSFVIPEIADFRRQRATQARPQAARGEAERAQRGRPREEASGRSDDTRAQRGAARERSGAFEHVLVTVEIH